jgi:hypothetical protein
MATRKIVRNVSPSLRAHVTEAARNIRAAHKAELADPLKTASAVRLFESTLRPRGKSGPLKPAPEVSAQRVGALANELGGLLSDAIRAGTGFFEGQLWLVAQAWRATAPRPAATPAAPDAAPPPTPAAEVLPPTPEEAMLLGVLRQFMPMILSTLNQGGDGYGLARTVIALFGRDTYDQAAGLGKDKIMQLVKSDPDLWAQVAPIEPRFTKFLGEFTSGADNRPSSVRT